MVSPQRTPLKRVCGRQMSALGHAARCRGRGRLSALPPKAEIPDLRVHDLGPVTAGEGPQALFLPRDISRRRRWPSFHFDTREQFDIAALSTSFQ